MDRLEALNKATGPTGRWHLLASGGEESQRRAPRRPWAVRRRRREECQLFADQSPYAVRFEWGERGLEAIRPGCSAVVIVDVFSFCTSVDVATGRGASVLPYPG